MLQVAKVLEFQLQHWSFQLIFRSDFLRTDWLDFFAVQGTLKSLLQQFKKQFKKQFKTLVLHHSAFFIVQLSYPYVNTGKTLTRQTFVGKVMSLLFNKWSRLVITFLPNSKHLLISRLQSPSAVILESPKIKSQLLSQ